MARNDVLLKPFPFFFHSETLISPSSEEPQKIFLSSTCKQPPDSLAPRSHPSQPDLLSPIIPHISTGDLEDWNVPGMGILAPTQQRCKWINVNRGAREPSRQGSRRGVSSSLEHSLLLHSTSPPIYGPGSIPLPCSQLISKRSLNLLVSIDLIFKPCRQQFLNQYFI